MSIYLINNEVVFDSNNLTLQSARTKSKQIPLGNVASRCLKVLLDADGKVVKKRELIFEVWGKLGLEVTDNSLAQAVRQIRTAIKELAPHQSTVLTMPRIGYKIASKVESIGNTQSQPFTLTTHRDFNIRKTKSNKASNIIIAGASSVIGFGLGSLFMFTATSL